MGSMQKYRAFVYTARCGSFTEAAAELGCAQSSVSRLVSALEGDWGLRLFERRGGLAGLTPEGKALLPEARQLVEANEQLNKHARDLNGLDAGVLSIAAPASILSRRLPATLGRFVTDHPRVNVDINEVTYGEAERLVSSGKVDVAFMPTQLKKEGFESTLFERDEIVVVAPRGHFADMPERLAVESLVDERFVADSETAPLLQQELTNTVQRFHTSDITAILAMVEAGLGISLLPSLALEGQTYRVDVRHLKNPARRSIYVVHRATGDLSRAAAAFLTYL